MRKRIVLGIIVSMLFSGIFIGCGSETVEEVVTESAAGVKDSAEEVEDVVEEVKDQASDVIQEDNEYVSGVKNGTNSLYPGTTYGEAFENFFAYPTWKYFEGTEKSSESSTNDNEAVYDVVEFTGYCTYQDVEVKALIQFTIAENKETFDATYLSFNEVPQDQLTLNALIEKAFEETLGEQNTDVAVTNETFKINYVVNESDEFMAGTWYQNSNGALMFESLEPLSDWAGGLDFGGKYVTYCDPESCINFMLENTGEEALINPTVKFEFTDVVIENVYEPFMAENHVNGIGGYAGAVLRLNETIQPGAETEVFVLNLSQALFVNGETATLDVTLSADNYSAKTYTIPLSLKK